MKILACFLLCSMLGGASEVLFTAAKNLFKGWFVRATRELSATSAPTQARPLLVIDSAPAISPGDVMGNPPGREPPARPRGSDTRRGAEPLRFEAAAWK